MTRSILLAAFLSLALVACGQNAEDAAPAEEAPVVEDVTPAEEAPVVEEAVPAEEAPAVEGETPAVEEAPADENSADE